MQEDAEMDLCIWLLPSEQELHKKDFFEFLQGQAEAALERLHRCAEKELDGYLKDSSYGDFKDFCTKLDGHTVVMRTRFEQLVTTLESGLSKVSAVTDGEGCSSKASASTSKLSRYPPLTQHKRKSKT